MVFQGIGIGVPGGDGEPFAQKMHSSCPNIYETESKRQRGSLKVHHDRPTDEVKIFVHMILSHELSKTI